MNDLNKPRLRFGGFCENWNSFKLSEVSIKIKDGTHFSPETSKIGDFQYLTSKNVKNGYLDFGNLEYISREAHQAIYKSCDVKFGDILLTKDGTIGQSCINTLTYEFSLLSSVAFIRPKSSYNNYFIYQTLISDIGKKEIKRAIAGQALKRVTLTKINDFTFNFPSLPEQQKIASFLTAVDDKIQLLTKKKELLTQYKKGVMQKLFNQEIRFKDDEGNDYPHWEEKSLGETGRIVGGGTPSSLNKFYWDGDIPWISSSDLTEDNIYEIKVSRLITNEAISHSATKIIPIGSVLVVSRVGVGKVAVNKEIICTSQDFSTIIPYNDSNIFLAYLIKSNINRLLEFNQGTSIKGFSKSSLENLKVFIPCIIEQVKIADFLSSIDSKIYLLNQQIIQSQIYKKGLLQQMFV